MITSNEQTIKGANLGSEQEIILRKQKVAYKWKWQICSNKKKKKNQYIFEAIGEQKILKISFC